MKLINHFDDFLNDTVNLNATRVTSLDDSIEAIKTVIRDSSWGPKIKTFSAQGSWAHKTIIKPVKGSPFDADLLVHISEKDDWDAKTYLDELYKVFANHGTYSDKVKRWSHCVTITYAGERKIDIAPLIVDRGGITRLEVCNRDSNAFEQSEPRLYTDWLIERNGWTGGNGLRKTTRFLKYLRDIKTTFTCPSVLLTTLVGLRIMAADDNNMTDFADTPTALKTIVGRLDEWLQANASKPSVTNPVLPSEDFSTGWDDTQYGNFRNKIHTYRTWIDDAYDEPDREESIGKWRRVFGDDFAKSVTIEKAATIGRELVEVAKASGQAPAGFVGDLVTLVARFGAGVLPASFARLAHKQRPSWRVLSPPAFTVTVTAHRHASRNGTWLEMVTPLPKGNWLEFSARTNTGMPLAGDFDVYWRVTNTDEQARQANCLRGEIIKSNAGVSHWEELAYRGVHQVEAFVVRKRDQMLVAQSAPYYVVIE